MEAPGATRSGGRFDVVDALTVVGPWRDRQPGQAFGLPDLLAEHGRYGIGRRLTLHAEARDGVPDEGNAELDRLTAARADTARIWMALPPRRFGGRSAERLVADAHTAGVAMFALDPETHGHHIAPWANHDLYAAMAAARLPLLLDLHNPIGAGARTAYQEIHAVATAYRDLPIVLWNAFYMDERLQVPLLDLCPNVRVGIATVYIPTWGIEQYTARYGPGRLLFGSNWPRQSPGPLLTYVLYADVDDAAKAAVLGGTVREMMGEVRWPVRGFEGAAATGSPVATGSAATSGGAAATGRAAADWRSATAHEAALDPRRAPGEEGE